MLTRTELIELQYEIAMAIGSSLDLRKMLRKSLSTLLKNLNCPIGGLLFTTRNLDGDIVFTPAFSIPLHAQNINVIQNALFTIPKNFTTKEYHGYVQSLPSKIKINADECVHFLELPSFGVIYLYTPKDYLSDDIIRVLIPLMSKLAIASRACIQNEELNKHRENLEELVSEQTNDLLAQKKQLEKSNVQLTELNATKNKFFSIIAHDLKAPFNGIIGLSDTLIDSYYKLSEEDKVRYITHINSEATKSYKLLENLLDWASIQTGRINFKPELINLRQLVESNIELLNRSASEKNIKLKSKLNSPIEVKADRQMINTVIRNLISNAIKFTPNKGNVVVEPLKSDNALGLTVVDTGVGFTDSQLDKLFKIGQSHNTKGTNKETGTGLGLILCREFIDMHQGEISIDSEPEKGSRISFTLPISQS